MTAYGVSAGVSMTHVPSVVPSGMVRIGLVESLQGSESICGTLFKCAATVGGHFRSCMYFSAGKDVASCTF